MSVTNKLTGKGASWTYRGAVIPFMKMTPTATRTMADSTDSTDYDVVSDMVWPSQIPVKVGQKFKVEGHFNTAALPSGIIADLYTGASAAAVVIKLTPSVTFGHGLFDIENFETGIPIDNIVSYSVDLTSNGVFVYGS